jgi:hypothetical protein
LLSDTPPGCTVDGGEVSAENDSLRIEHVQQIDQSHAQPGGNVLHHLQSHAITTRCQLDDIDGSDDIEAM